MLIRHLFPYCFMALASCCALQASAQQAYSPAYQHEQDLLEQVSEFLAHFIDPAKTPEQQAELFAQDAQYYEHGRAGKAAIVKDIRYFSRRWPYRDYRLRNIHYITPDPASDRLFVSYEIDYWVANHARTVSGRARYGAVLVNPSTSPKVEWIKESIGRN